MRKILYLFMGLCMMTGMTGFSNSVNFDFEKAWKEVETLREKQLPKSALEKVEIIYSQAKKEKNVVHEVKALQYKAMFTIELEEEGFKLAVNELTQHLTNAETPARQVLHAVLADIYLSYFNQQRYRIGQRTPVSASVPAEFEFWTTSDFLNKISHHYLQSVADAGSLKVSVDKFAPLLNDFNNEGKNFRPTLFEVLAAKALNYLRNAHSHLTEPSYSFVVDQDEYFAPLSAFIELNISTEATLSHKFQTLKLFQDVLRFETSEKNRTALADFDLMRVSFVYGQAVQENKKELYKSALQRMMKSYADVSVYTEIVNAYVQTLLTEDHVDRYTRAVKLGNEAIDKYPKSPGARNLLSTIHQIKNKELNLITEQVYLPQRENIFQVSYKNLDKAYVRIIELSDKEAFSLGQDRKKASSIIARAKKVEAYEIKLPDEGQHHTHTVEQILPALPFGQYAILLSNDNKFDAEKSGLTFAVFNVSNIAYALMSRDKGQILVTNRTTGQPLEGVTVKVYQQNYNRNDRDYNSVLIQTIRTNKEGKANIVKQNNRNLTVELINGKDVLNVMHHFNIWQSGVSKDYKQEYIFTDRSIYRPGQTIYYKALLLSYDKDRVPSIRKNEKVTITLRDANYQEVATESLASNDFGSLSGHFVLPDVKLTGNFTLTIGNANHAIRVEEYKRPRFEIKMDSLKSNYALNDTVIVTGKATNLSGNPVDGASVRYVVTRKVQYSPWRYRYLPVYDQGATQITRGITTTNSAGEFSFPTALSPDRNVNKKHNPSFSYEISVDVTDITGETRSDVSYISAGYAQFIISAEMKKDYNRNDSIAVTLKAMNHSGAEIKEDLSIKIYALQSPENIKIDKYWEQPDTFVISAATYAKKFPHYSREGTSDIFQWKEGNVVRTDMLQSGQQMLLDDLLTGAYKLQATSIDENGEKVEFVHYFTVNDYNRDVFTKDRWLHFYVDKASSLPGDTVTISFGSAEKGLHVYAEVMRKGVIEESRWIDVDRSQVLSVPIRENDRGGINVNLTWFYQNRATTENIKIHVPWSNKDLKIDFITFRDKLKPGSEEEWKIKISGPKGDMVSAEVLAGMYDASLDQLNPHSWKQTFFPLNNGYSMWQLVAYNATHGSHLNYKWNRLDRTLDTERIILPEFNSVILQSSIYPDFRYMRPEQSGKIMDEVMVMGMAGNQVESKESMESDAADNSMPPSAENEVNNKTSDNFPIRKNLEETVFFFPQLQTDKEGSVILSFTMKEALTRWNLKLFAHTTDLKYAFDQKEVLTQKEIMVFPNAPRFLRQGDDIELTGKVVNMTDQSIKGSVRIELEDAISGDRIDADFSSVKSEKSIDIAERHSAAVSWNLTIPQDYLGAIRYRMIAVTDNHSDGEESTIPVVTNRMLITETLPMHVKGNKENTFRFTAMQKESDTRVHHNFTLEFTSNPVWYAIQALPYLMEYPYDCTEQIMNRLYANTLASGIANNHPKIKRVFDQWKNYDSDALLSNLSKNEELKSALLEETPWVLSAQSETAQKKNIALLFELNKMSAEKSAAITQLVERQMANGGFSWMPGGRDDVYITQYLLEDLGHMIHLGVLDPKKEGLENLIHNAVSYSDRQLEDRFDRLKENLERSNGKLEDHQPANIDIHYLYMRSFYPEIPVRQESEEALRYYRTQVKKYWTKYATYLQGLIALQAKRNNEGYYTEIIKSLKERAVENEELGVYWKDVRGFRWYELPVERQALMIELFTEAGGHDDLVESMKIWLLKNKQTTHWRSTKATAAAIYALLLNKGKSRMSEWILQDELPNIALNGKDIVIDRSQVEAGTGYFKKTYSANSIPEKAVIKVKNNNDVVAWGAAYWQYFEDIDKVEAFDDTPLQLRKTIFIQKMSDSGVRLEPIKKGARLNPGDKLTVRIELTSDRDMEYMHMKDLRASGLEPLNVLSRYKYQDGLGYYESTRDLATHFFISFLPKGSYVFEYPLVVVHKGSFSGGVTTIQSMYAPEFSSHSQGERLEVRGAD